jgi:hypothetical protein
MDGTALFPSSILQRHWNYNPTSRLWQNSEVVTSKIGLCLFGPKQIYAKFNANPKEYHTPSVSTQQSGSRKESMLQNKRKSDAADVIAAKTLAEREKVKVAAKAHGKRKTKEDKLSMQIN